MTVDEWAEVAPEYSNDETQALAQAIKAGREVIISDDKHLLLDIDTEEDFKALPEKLKRLNEKFGLSTIKWKHSKSGHWHVVVELDLRVTDKVLRFCLEQCLGSDWKRGIHNVKNWLDNKEPVGMLFTVKENPWSEIKL